MLVLYGILPSFNNWYVLPFLLRVHTYNDFFLQKSYLNYDKLMRCHKVFFPVNYRVMYGQKSAEGCFRVCHVICTIYVLMGRLTNKGIWIHMYNLLVMRLLYILQKNKKIEFSETSDEIEGAQNINVTLSFYHKINELHFIFLYFIWIMKSDWKNYKNRYLLVWKGRANLNFRYVMHRLECKLMNTP